MNTVSLAVATLVLGIDVGWQPVDDKGLEYIIQIEPQLLASLRSGEDIVSDLPPDLQGVRSFRVTVGTGRVPRVANRQPTSAGAAGGTTTARQPLGTRTPMNSGVLNLPPPPIDVAPSNSGVLNLPPPPVDDYSIHSNQPGGWHSSGVQPNATQSTVPQAGQARIAPPTRPQTNPFPSSQNPARVVPFQPNQPTLADPLAAPPGNYAIPPEPANRTRSTTPIQPPAPAFVENPAPQETEKVYQLEVLNARLPAGVSRYVEEGPELMAKSLPIPKSTEKPIAQSHGESTDAKSTDGDTAAAPTTEAKPWGWLILSLLALSISVGLNFFLGWVNWGFRQRYEDLLDRMQSLRTRTA